MKVAVLGYGTVGKGVYDILRTSPLFEAGPVLVRPGKTDEPFKTDSMEAICADGSIDAVAETMGGIDAAYSYASMALKAGKHFVTSNKALVAARGIELAALAREHGAGFLFSAACGGAVPFLHNLELACECDEIYSLGGILNGTTNYMLDMMQSEGLDYDAALKDAQALGYAEADPTADVTGLDALRKIMLGCAVAYDLLPDEGLLNEGIDSLRASDVEDIKARGLCCRLIVIQIGSMHQFINLAFQRLVVARIMIAQGLYRDACGEVQVFIAVCVVEIDAVAVIQHHLIPVVGVKHALFRLFDNRLFIFHHNNFPLLRPEWRYRFHDW